MTAMPRIFANFFEVLLAVLAIFFWKLDTFLPNVIFCHWFVWFKKVNQKGLAPASNKTCRFLDRFLILFLKAGKDLERHTNLGKMLLSHLFDQNTCQAPDFLESKSLCLNTRARNPARNDLPTT